VSASSDFAPSFEDLRRRLQEVNRAWTVDNHQSLLSFFVHIIPKLLDAERCGVFIRDPGSGRILSHTGTGLGEAELEPPLEGSVVGRAIATGRSVVENDLRGNPGFHRTAAALTGFETRNLVCVPIESMAGHGVAGAIEVLNKVGDDGFGEHDVALLRDVAVYLSTALENVLLNKEIIRLSGRIEQKASQLRCAYLGDVPFIAESEAMRGVIELVRMVSQTPVSVVIHGENGTGKEVVARMIHERGDRRDKPFVAVNCAAIPESLTESEFFGYDKGAFTGAVATREGRFEEANGGTLFLDEVGEMPMSMQPKFLRAIHEGEGSRLGSNKVVSYDLRVISANNRRLSDLVAAGLFREDLYYRLFAVEIVVPPLRERREDIAPLSQAFLADVCRRYGKSSGGFSNDLLTVFEHYCWPGNVRQLRREVERLVALSPDGERLTRDRCSPEILMDVEQRPDPAREDLSMPERVRALELRLIEEALEQTGGNKGRAAELLGITRQGLHKKLRRYGGLVAV